MTLFYGTNVSAACACRAVLFRASPCCVLRGVLCSGAAGSGVLRHGQLEGGAGQQAVLRAGWVRGEGAGRREGGGGGSITFGGRGAAGTRRRLASGERGDGRKGCTVVPLGVRACEGVRGWCGPAGGCGTPPLSCGWATACMHLWHTCTCTRVKYEGTVCPPRRLRAPTRPA